MHPKFDLIAKVRTHDLQIMDSTFHVPEMLVLTNGSSGIFLKSVLPHYLIYAYIGGGRVAK